jgi:DNA polymerase-3 subunit delta
METRRRKKSKSIGKHCTSRELRLSNEGQEPCTSCSRTLYDAAMATSRPVASVMRLEDYFARIDKGTLAPLYLFHGEESYLIEQAIVHVRHRLGPATPMQIFYVGEDPIDRLLEQWGTPSLFASQRVLVLKGAERLKAAERERLTREADGRDASQPLVVCAYSRIDLTQPFFALCVKQGVTAEFRLPFANQLPGWAQQLARERKIQLTEGAATLLADYIGPDLFALATEIDKLVAFVAPRQEIDVDDVNVCSGALYKHSAFDLADALGQRDRQKALALLRTVLADERNALPVLHALVSHFRRVWQVKELSRSGVAEAQMERVIGLRGPRLRSLVSQSRMYSVTDLRQLVHRAASLDLLFKSSRVSPHALFDALVLDVCTQKAERG